MEARIQVFLLQCNIRNIAGVEVFIWPTDSRAINFLLAHNHRSL